MAIDVARLRVSSVTFGRCYLPSHYHERACLSVVLDGGFSERFARRAIECRAGGVLAKPAGERHDDVMFGSRQIIVEPAAELARALPETSSVFDEITYRPNDVATAVALRIHHELREQDAFTALAVEGLTMELLTVVRRGQPRDRATGPVPAWLARVRERLDEDARSATVAELSAIAQVHPGYLARRFRHHFGMSIGRYARRLRLEWAARQLSGSDEPISSMSLRAGFADQSHFTRAFRNQTGLTPRLYRLATRR